MLLTIIFFLGCDYPCTCNCENCGVNCRNVCNENNCTIGQPCCDKCKCYKKPSIKIKN